MCDAEVIIVGGGIGGLAAAIALRQRGVEVIVLEQAPELGEIGAGLLLAPNACKVLDHLGALDFLLAGRSFGSGSALGIARLERGFAFCSDDSP